MTADKSADMFAAMRRHAWRWQWSGNWPTFDTVHFFSRGYAAEWERAVGWHMRTGKATFLASGVSTIYMSVQEHDAMSRVLKEKFRKEPGFVLRTLAEYEQRSADDTAKIKTLVSEQPGTLSDTELLDRFRQARSCLTYNRFIDDYDCFCERYLQDVLEEWLEHRVPRELLAERITLLTRPQHASPASREREEFFAIADEMKRNPAFVRAAQGGADALGRFPHFAQLLERHLRAHENLRVVVNADPGTMDDLWADVQKFVGRDEQYEVQEHRPGDKYDPALVREANALLESLDPPEEIRLLVRGIQRAVHLRVLDNYDQGITTALLRPLYEEFARRIGVTYARFKAFTDDELCSYLSRGERIPPALVEERWALTAYCLVDDRIVLETGATARELLAIAQGSSQNAATQTVFNGKAASKGVVRGRARVVTDIRDAAAMLSDEVLITPSVGAYFVPFLRSAAAIVTEIPSLTSHAVVVARESGVPCVVGVSGITKEIRSGDMVEVDGAAGVVRLLARK
jgi:phosphohistidine swiveling domain-containing protein